MIEFPEMITVEAWVGATGGRSVADHLPRLDRAADRQARLGP
jgi:hypothetical protein